MPRGFSVIALDNPKTPANVGSVLRAAEVYGAGLVVISGQRYQRAPTDVTKAWRHLPLLQVPDVFDAIPYDCVPVAVELVDGAQPLPFYRHPERAFYVFGAEDATLGKRVLGRCRDRVMIPMARNCMNLSAAVNVVLYDRLAKAMMLDQSRIAQSVEHLTLNQEVAGSSPAPAATLEKAT